MKERPTRARILCETEMKLDGHFFHKCGFTFFGRASEQTEIFAPKIMKSRAACVRLVPMRFREI